MDYFPGPSPYRSPLTKSSAPIVTVAGEICDTIYTFVHVIFLSIDRTILSTIVTLLLTLRTIYTLQASNPDLDTHRSQSLWVILVTTVVSLYRYSNNCSIFIKSSYFQPTIILFLARMLFRLKSHPSNFCPC